MTQDKELQEVYCAWAESKLGKRVEEVRFKQWYDHGYSEYTPGEGSTVDVEVKVNGKWKWIDDYTESNIVDLIHEITQFAYDYK